MFARKLDVRAFPILLKLIQGFWCFSRCRHGLLARYLRFYVLTFPAACHRYINFATYEGILAGAEISFVVKKGITRGRPWLSRAVALRTTARRNGPGAGAP